MRWIALAAPSIASCGSRFLHRCSEARQYNAGMRWLAVLALCGSCSVEKPAPYYASRMVNCEPRSALDLAIETARQQGYEPTLVGEPSISGWPRYSFVAVPRTHDDARINVVYFVHIVPPTNRSWITTLTVTPFGYRDGQPVEAEGLPLSARASANQLLAAIWGRVQESRDPMGM